MYKVLALLLFFSFQTSESMFLVNLDIFLFSVIFSNFLEFSVIFNVFRTDCFYIFGFERFLGGTPLKILSRVYPAKDLLEGCSFVSF